MKHTIQWSFVVTILGVVLLSSGCAKKAAKAIAELGLDPERKDPALA